MSVEAGVNVPAEEITDVEQQNESAAALAWAELQAYAAARGASLLDDFPQDCDYYVGEPRYKRKYAGALVVNCHVVHDDAIKGLEIVIDDDHRPLSEAAIIELGLQAKSNPRIRSDTRTL